MVVTTNLLLTIIAAILAYKFVYPVWKAKQAAKADAKQARMRAEVEPFYQEYVVKRKALRTKHDPDRKWSQFAMNDPGMPKEYVDEVAALTEAYKGILAIKFGDHILMPSKSS